MKEKRKIKLMKTRLKIFTSLLSVLSCRAFLPTMQAQLPPEIPGNPDGCYPAFTTAEGCNALHQLFGGIGNSAFGWYSLFLVGDASFNTGVGAGTLALTTTGADSNTAVGTAAMILNVFGNRNTAVGTNALVGDPDFGNSGDFNGAVGAFALYKNFDGSFNNAFGDSALFSNVDGSGNTAVGDNALTSSVVTSDNTAIGDSALAFNDFFGTGNGIHNVAVGSEALENNTEARNNTAVGAEALRVNDSTGNNLASNNTAV